ncbi:MAG: nitroreductase family protein [Anaerolineales bacterium]
MSTTATDLHNFMRTRRSVRRFKSDPVPDSVIETILTTATFAPSAHNRQPWRFVVVANSFVRTKLAEAMAIDFQRDLESDGIPTEKIQAQVKRSKDRIISAPVAILLLHSDMSEMDRYPDKRRTKSRIQNDRTIRRRGRDATPASRACGGRWEQFGRVGSCLLLKRFEVLELPKTWEPQALYFLGYPDGNPKEKILKVMKSVVRTI